MSMKLYLSEEEDIYTNIALERRLFRSRESCLFLWRNAPCVVIGRNQNPYQEADTAYMEENGISLARRYTGGGAVYQDRGNLNYSWIGDRADVSLVISIIADALRRFSIDIRQSGRNDLLYRDRKISGMAFLEEDSWYLYHGTLMLDVDIDRMTRVLTPSAMKLESKGIASVRARVCNLSDSRPELTVESMTAAVSAAAGIPIERLHAEQTDQELQRNIAELGSSEWIYGQSMDYQVTLREKIHGENYTIFLNVCNDRITGAQIASDALTVFDNGRISGRLLGNRFRKDTILQTVRESIGG